MVLLPWSRPGRIGSTMFVLDGDKDKAITVWKEIAGKDSDPEVLYQAVKCLSDNLGKNKRAEKSYLKGIWKKFVDAYKGADASKFEEAKSIIYIPATTLLFTTLPSRFAIKTPNRLPRWIENCIKLGSSLPVASITFC